MSDVKSVVYTDILNLAGAFVALDISVQSTGYVCKGKDGTYTYGTYKIKATEDIARRKEFADFLVSLLETVDYDYVVIEDVIMGNNFDTTKILMQLNVIVEDLMVYGRLRYAPVYRQNNKHWKSVLERISGYNAKVKGLTDKARVCESLQLLGFIPPQGTPQDVYDAMGIAVAQIAETNIIMPQQMKAVTTEHVDLCKGYKITQCNDEESLMKLAEKTLQRCQRFRNVVLVDSKTQSKTLKDAFRRIVLEHGDDNVFAIVYDVDKIGSLLLTKHIDVTICDEYVYFLARLR